MASSKSQRQARTRPASRNSPKSTIATRKAESIGFGGGHVFLLLLALRILNALTIKTFFQPDEYYQSLEPAWRLAFGADSGAWITWEWRNQLRSSLHPILFAGVYHAAALFSNICNLSPVGRTGLFLAAPKVTQAVFAAGLDYYTWKLAQRVYGRENFSAWTTLALTALSPWQWFCSTRTLSNCIEAALTAAALFFWPWHWMLARTTRDALDTRRLRRDLFPTSPLNTFGEVTRLRASLLLAATASVLRPTNVLTWLPLSLQSLQKASTRERQVLVIEAIRCGIIVAAVTALLDRWYYGLWTFPPWRFLHFNITKSLAVFYGTNRSDYYLTEGLPLLLMTALPFAGIALFRGATTLFSRTNPSPQGNFVETVRSTVTCIVVFVVSTLSFISHKEARFLYPLLSPLLVLASLPLTNFLRYCSAWKYPAVLALLGINLVTSYYTTQAHQRGVIDVMDYVRSQHELGLQAKGNDSRTSVAFLMPCHSTPWRSHLVYPEIDAWALTCEPPLDVHLDSRSTYIDEADFFYGSPITWLKTHMEDTKMRFSYNESSVDRQSRNDDGRVVGKGRSWPDYLVTFAGLETTLKVFLKNTPYRVCKRLFNTHKHDDRRRIGDVVVWCLS